MNRPEKMVACALWGVRDLRVEQADVPRPQPGQVLVKIHAAGICGSDVERVFTKGTYHYPTIIGHEFSGQVVETCEEDKDWLGKRVSVFPLIPCMKCPACREGRYAQCSHYDYYGSRRDGGFAEYLAVNTWNLLPIPDGVSYESAAMFEPAAVAVHALRQAGELSGRSVVIFGIGTIGLILAQVAQNSGCGKVILVARSQEKVELAQKMGFSYVVNSQKEPLQQKILEWTGGSGADIAVEGCGKSETLGEALQVAAPFGTVVCMGNPVENIDLQRDVYWEILRKQLRLCGTWNSSFGISHNDWEAVLGMVQTGRLKLQELITGRYALSQAQEAFDDIRSRRTGIHLKSMFINEGETE